MAIRKRCLYCGEPVSTNGYCTSCKLSQTFLRKAFNTSNYHYNIGLNRARVRDLSGAVDSLKMSLRYNKKNIDARNLLGLIYYELGEEVMAMSHWVMSANYQPKNNLAIGYLKELRDDPRRLEEVSNNARMFNQALIYAKQRDFDLAFIQLNKVCGSNPHNIKAHLLMALIYTEQGRNGKAKKILERVISIDRTNTTAIHLLRELGASEEGIIKIRDKIQDEDEASQQEEYYGVMQEEVKTGQRPARKILVETPVKKKTTDGRIKRYKEINMARFSNIYMLVGMIIGIAVFYMLIIPAKNRKYNQEISDIKASYSEQLASKNGTVSNLSKQVDDLNDKITELEDLKEENEAKIQDLTNQLENIKNQIPASDTVIQGQDTSEEGEAANTVSEGGGSMSSSEVGDIIGNE